MSVAVFISQSDHGPAGLLESVISRAFPGEITVFNTGRAASGLASGDALDAGIIERIRSAGVVVWLASPRSVHHSFWMAWELGVAHAVGIRVLPACCWGISGSALPLLQAGRFAPDLGEKDELVRLLSDLGDSVERDTQGVTGAVDRLLEAHAGNNPFWGMEAPDTLRIRVLGARMMIENQLDDQLTIIQAHAAAGELPWVGPKELSARERRIVDLPSSSSVEIGEFVGAQWRVTNQGRFYSSIAVSD